LKHWYSRRIATPRTRGKDRPNQKKKPNVVGTGRRGKKKRRGEICVVSGKA